MIENIGDSGSKNHPKLNTIRGLLAKANAEGVTPAEAETLLAKAREMSARHGIDMAMAAAAGSKEDELCLKEFETEGEFDREQATLLYYVLEGSGAKCIMTSLGLSAVGFTSDLERGELLYTSLLLQMTSSVINECPSDTHRERAKWMVGFAQAIGLRLTEARLAAQKDAGSQYDTGKMELALRSREELVREAYEAEFPVRGHGRMQRASWGGMQAGRNAVLSGTGVGGRGRAAIG
jgi:hypothetical protein